MKQCKQHKERFGTEKQCLEWIDKWNKTSANKKGKKKLTIAYLCPNCLTWHATSQAQIDEQNVIEEVRRSIIEQRKENESILIAISDFKNYLNSINGKVNEQILIDKQILKKINEL